MATTQKVFTIYMSLVSGNTVAIKNLQRLTLILDGNKIKYQQIDISLDENKEHKELMRTKTKSKKPTMTPQVFYNGMLLLTSQLGNCIHGHKVFVSCVWVNVSILYIIINLMQLFNSIIPTHNFA